MYEHIKVNRIKCKACGDIVTSKHRHDFISCGCGKVAADGGNEYLRRVGELHQIEDLSEYYTEDEWVKRNKI